MIIFKTIIVNKRYYCLSHLDYKTSEQHVRYGTQSYVRKHLIRMKQIQQIMWYININKDDKNTTVIYGAWRHKTTFYRLFLITDDPVFNKWKG